MPWFAGMLSRGDFSAYSAKAESNGCCAVQDPASDGARATRREPWTPRDRSAVTESARRQSQSARARSRHVEANRAALAKAMALTPKFFQFLCAARIEQQLVSIAGRVQAGPNG